MFTVIDCKKMNINIAYAAVVSVIFALISMMLLEIYYFACTIVMISTNNITGSKILRERGLSIFTNPTNVINFKFCLIVVLIGNASTFIPALLWLTVKTQTKLERVDGSINFSMYGIRTHYNETDPQPVYVLNSKNCSGLVSCIELREPINRLIDIPGERIKDALALSFTTPAALDEITLQAKNYLAEVDYYGSKDNLWLSKLECATGVNISIYRAPNQTRYNIPDCRTAQDFLTLPYSQNRSQADDGFPISEYSQQGVNYCASTSIKPDLKNAQSTYQASIYSICSNINRTDNVSIGMITLEETWMLVDKYEKRYDFITDNKRSYCKDYISASLANGGNCSGTWSYIEAPSSLFGNDDNIALTRESIETSRELNNMAKSNAIYKCPCKDNTDDEIVAQTATIVNNKHNARSSRTKGNQHMSVLCMRSANDLATACKIMRVIIYPINDNNTVDYGYNDLKYYGNSTNVVANFHKIESKKHVGCMKLDLNTSEFIASTNYIAVVSGKNAQITILQSRVSYNINIIIIILAGIIAIIYITVKLIAKKIGRSNLKVFTESLTGLD